jgi:hypothetical protein
VVKVIEVTVVAVAMDRMSPDPAPLTLRYFVLKSPSVALEEACALAACGAATAGLFAGLLLDAAGTRLRWCLQECSGAA